MNTDIKVSEANRQLIRDVPSGSSSKRASRVIFDTVVLAFDPVDSETPGRLHAETLVHHIFRAVADLACSRIVDVAHAPMRIFEHFT